MMNMYFKIALIGMIAVSNCAAAGFYFEPVAPTLATRYVHAMVYKGLADRYRSILETVEQYWRIPGTVQGSSSCGAAEEGLEALFEVITKQQDFQSIDAFLLTLECDIHMLERLEQAASNLPSEVNWLPHALTKMRAALSFVHELVTHHKMYQFSVTLHATLSGSFARELALLKSRQLATLNSYMRSSHRDYAKELTVWIERLKVLCQIVRGKYPRIGQEMSTLLKNCEGLKSIYTKL